ncbi:MAG: response regulator [Bradymonadaceae bacterium]
MTDSPPTTLRKILVVEDDPHIREVAQMALERTGDLEVATCGKGADAYDHVREFAPDLVLLDVMMPEVDGLEVFEQLQADETTSSVPVVLLTARAQPDELEEYHQRGVADVIVKPFDPVALPEQVRDVWSTLDP